MAPRFETGSKVRLRATPTINCAIVSGPRAQASGWEYEVLIEGTFRWIDESQLEALDNGEELRWVANFDLARIQLLLAKLQNPQTDALYSYRASRTEFEPYQFRPALKFLRNIHGGILIADEVGLGKTIEAAIIYLELKARVDASRVLILCPSRLCKKWQDELQNRFGETFVIWDTSKVREHFDIVNRGLGGELKAIASFETLRNPELFQRWSELGISLDLLIVDEAHNLRNENTRQYQLGMVLTQSADAVVFLSATPLHLGNKDLFNLLHLIAPDEFNDLNLFGAMVEPNTFVNDAIALISARQIDSAIKTLRKVETTRLKDRYLQNPYYREAVKVMYSLRGSSPSRSDALHIQSLLADLNTLSGVLTRTRKREMTKAAVRSAHSVIVELNKEERALYNGALRRTEAQIRTRKSNAGSFGSVMEERQAASCLPAYAKKLAQGTGAVSLEVEPSQFDLLAEDEAQPAIQAAPRIGVSANREDSKLARLMDILGVVRGEGTESKALVFSFFRGTIEYLRSELTKLGYSPLVLHGGVKMPDRYRIIDEFKHDPRRQVLISSEVGAEGLDFQFCNVLVNYDLPWNPMQVEQRIGRLDRFGQRNEKIRIYNFFIADTIETRILQRLYDRIEIFRRSIGDLEDILGKEIRQVTDKALSGNLSPEDQQTLAEEAALRILRRKKADDELEAAKDRLLGQGQLLDNRVHARVNSGRVIAPAEVKVLILSFLDREFPMTIWRPDDDLDCGVLELDPRARDHLRRVIERKGLRTRMSEHLNRALAGDKRLRMTFDSDVARQAPDLDFVTVSHPIAVAAREYWESQPFSGIPCVSVELPALPQETGDGAFFVYEIQVAAVEDNVTMVPLVILSDGRLAKTTSGSLLRLLQSSALARASASRDITAVSNLRTRADGVIASTRSELESEAVNRNAALLAAREASINSSFNAKIDRARRFAATLQDERITRMWAAHAVSLEVKRNAKLAELQSRQAVSVTSRLVLAGTILLR